MKWVPLGMVLGMVGASGSSIGCHHYSIPDHGVAVQVDTVALAPQWSASEAELTRRLVELLQSRGFESHWEASSEESSNRVNCALDIEEWRTDTLAFARATSICSVGLQEVRAVGRSRGHQDVSHAVFEAARDTLERTLPGIEKALGVTQ